MELIHTVVSSTDCIAISICVCYSCLTILTHSSCNQQSANFYYILSAVPAKVSGVTFLLSPDENTLSVEWDRPHSDAPILHYEIRYRQQTGGPSWQGPVTATTDTVTLHSLVPSASYGVQVRAVSRIGAGQYSIEVLLRGYFICAYTSTHTHTKKKKKKKKKHTRTHTHTCTHSRILMW